MEQGTIVPRVADIDSANLSDVNWVLVVEHYVSTIYVPHIPEGLK